MIVPSMSHLEICDALFADKPKLDLKREQLRPRVVKFFKKENHFPAWHYEEYVHQASRNRYLIWFYAVSRQNADNPDTGFIAFLESEGEKVVIRWGTWGYRLPKTTEYIATRTIAFYSHHFFDRYRERIWPDANISFYELLCRYFSRNQRTIPVKMNEDIKHGYQEHGEDALYSFKVTDGICYIRSWNEGDITTVGSRQSNFISVVAYITFVDRDTMTDGQNAAIKEAEQEYLKGYYRSLYRDKIAENSRQILFNNQ